MARTAWDKLADVLIADADAVQDISLPEDRSNILTVMRGWTACAGTLASARSQDCSVFALLTSYSTSIGPGIGGQGAGASTSLPSVRSMIARGRKKTNNSTIAVVAAFANTSVLKDT